MSLDWRLLQNRFMVVFLLSRLCLQTGVWVRNIAILLFVMDKTGSDPFAVALVSIAEYLPVFLFTLLGGIMADQFRSRRMIIICDVLSGVSVFAVLAALMSGEWKAIFFVTFMSAVLSQFSEPSAMRMFKRQIPAHQLQGALALYQTVMSVFTICGPVIGTFVYQGLGIEVAVAWMAAAFFISGAILMLLPRDRNEPVASAEAGLLVEVKAGVRYVLQRPVLRRVGLLFLTLGLSIGLIDPVSVFIVTEKLGLAKEDMQWLMTANGIGMIIGSLLAVLLAQRVRAHVLLTIGLVATAFSIGVTGWSESLTITLAARVFGGACMPLMMSGLNTLILQNSDDHYIGRSTGMLNLLIMFAMVIGVAVSTQLMEATSLTTVFEVAAWVMGAGVLVSLPLFKLLAPPKRTKRRLGPGGWKEV